MEGYANFLFALIVIWKTGLEIVSAESNATTAKSEVSLFSACKNSSDCSLSEGFICKDGHCKCAYEEASRFDPESKKCVAKVNGQCGFFIGSSNQTILPCPESSICIWDNEGFKTSYQYAEKYCVCTIGHYVDGSGKCVPYVKHGEACNEHRKCDLESDLTCSSTTSTCQCPFGEDQYYDMELRKCISFVNGNCTMYCVDNAFCENYMPPNPKSWNPPPDAVGRDYSRETICQCRPGYEPSPDRRCRLIPPGYNSPCHGEDEQCDSRKNLRCIDKVCQCMNPLHQSYSFEIGRCIGMIGDVCDPEMENNCVLNSKCMLDESSKQHVCKCEEGYSTTPSKKCMKGFGQQCKNEFCNVFSGLACINRTCQCYDSFLKYDDASMSCVSAIGAPCGKVYMPLEPDDFAINTHGGPMRNQFVTNTFRNQYMNMKALCMECDGYHISCPNGSVCASDSEVLVVVRGKEKRRCRVPAT